VHYASPSEKQSQEPAVRRASKTPQLDMRLFTEELVRLFFQRKLAWAVPVGFILLVLMALIIASDGVPLAPFELHHSL
jgi:hypothetical protein